jgi:hypothetical protein
MAATYDSSLIATNIIYFARARLFDFAGLSGTIVTKPLFQDEVYQGFIDRLGDREGLAQCSEALGAVFAQKVQKYAESGGIDIMWPARPQIYFDVAKSIRINGVDMVNASLYAGQPITSTPCNDARLRLEPWF